MRAFFVLALGLAGAGHAAETLTYTYDARGRLVKVERSGGPNSGITTNYTIDRADNRTLMTTGSGGPAPPAFSIADTSVNEGGTLSFTVSKSGSTSSSFNVDFSTADGSALAGSDFDPINGTLTFAPAEASKLVNVSTIQDSTVEGDETMFVNLGNATGGATITDSQAVGTIINEDGGANQPPVANGDNAGFVPVCTSVTMDVVANDTDPDNNYPLSLVGVQDVSPAGYGDAFASSSTEITFNAGATGGGVQVTYIVQDSLGAQATGVMGLEITGSGCN